MDLSLQNKIVSFIWSIADDCLRDVYVRGKYRDVILPMFVLRRLDCLLEETKNAVVEEVSFQREEAGFTVLDPVALREESGYVFYNTSDLLTELGTTEDNLPDYGYWTGKKAGEWVEYESDSELRDTENVPLKEQIHDYFVREVRPHVADAWIALDKTQIGYEISFNKYFYQHKPLRTLEEVTAEILQLERETEGLLKRLVSFGEKN